MEEAVGFGTPEHGWTSIFFQTANLTGLRLEAVLVHEENRLEDPVPTLEEIKTGLEHLQTIGAIEEVGASGMFRIRDRGNSRPVDISMT